MTLCLTICPLDAHYYAASRAAGTLFQRCFITAHLSRRRLRQHVISKHCYLSGVRSSADSIDCSTSFLLSPLFPQLWWQNDAARRWETCPLYPANECTSSNSTRGKLDWRLSCVGDAPGGASAGVANAGGHWVHSG